MAKDDHYWLREGQGIGPKCRWVFRLDGGLTSMGLARETAEVVIADETGAVQRLDRKGQLAVLTRMSGPARLLDYCDSGEFGVLVVRNENLRRFDRDLKIEWKIDLPERITAIAISPFGNQMACSLADNSTIVLNNRKKKICRFETVRPLQQLRFCHKEPLLIGATDDGFVCCHDLEGRQVWSEKMWNNIGALDATGEGEMIFLAAFNQGIQALNGQGASLGAYVLEGTARRLAASYEPHRLIVATTERFLYWLDADGELLWATGTPADISHLACDPLGEWAICGFVNGDVLRLDW